MLTDEIVASDLISSTLIGAAFGDDPGRWPLPSAQSSSQMWLRAVAAAGQGRYGSAQADLAVLRREKRTGPLVSLACSTQASFLRQLGHHRLARGWDGRALALAEGAGDSALGVAAGIDALIGLAADALGIGRLAASARLLERAHELIEANDAGVGVPPRSAIRLAWVSAELAMAAGEGAIATRHAEHGVELAEQASPRLCRHRIKSDVVLAAALCSAGSLSRSRVIADEALNDTLEHGLVPLRWALTCLLVEIGSTAHQPQVLMEIRAECAAIITRRGGQWCGG